MPSEEGKPSLFRGAVALLAQAVLDRIAPRPAPSPEVPREPPRPDFLETVKLIHSEQLREWTSFPRYEDVSLVSHAQYDAERARVRSICNRDEIRSALQARLDDLDCDDMVATPSFEIVVPSAWRWRPVRVPAQGPPHEGAVLKVSHGRAEDGYLVATTRWWPQLVTAHYDVPKRTINSDAIASLIFELAALGPVDPAEVEAARASRFLHPILFVSHRWAAAEHPDPAGAQLERLRLLEDCFLIYDYTSFPQIPASVAEAEGLRAVLDNMHRLLKNVVVLDAPDYVERGWCTYEYLGACLSHSVVCDEIQDDRFVQLRNWAATRSPAPFNLYHDGWEAMMDNRISVSTLAALNELSGTLSDARFSLDRDRATVRRLLVVLLIDRLPSRKTLAPQGGEASKTRWTEADLDHALDAGFSLPELEEASVEPFRVVVPASLREAIKARYAIRIHPTREYLLHQVRGSFAPLVTFQDQHYDQPIPPS